MSYTTITSQIFTILTNLISTTTLSQVSNYDLKVTNKFPYAVVSVWESTEDIIDTCNNEAVYNITVRVVDQNKDVSTMETRMRLLADDILDEFRKDDNQTLQWNVEKFVPFNVVWGWADNQIPTRFFDINCEVTKLYSIKL
jgi:hypothetical protein